MLEPATASWDVSISKADFAKLKAGFEPQNQDHKWRIWHTQEGHSNNTLIHYARTGTGTKMYILHVKPNDGDGNIGANITAITWTQKKGGTTISEMQGKKHAIIITRAVLDCDIEALPEYSFKDIWNRSAATLPVDEQRKRDSDAYLEKLKNN
ncbi:hypothetical protein BKA58DRAFT_387574 [Alternaria rosae]|uniref:uncharacterized protein n=1 Tax=Alternaria rosae TaxID=1187941 RepID=UPI001E8DB93B|nr:uncharacterized protein BKA58DRAFT_387574 [Alternaria rosae]KAH6868776.1 hypothetical protein BKA58DRAFT_387574 [Alternaria rosae]